MTPTENNNPMDPELERAVSEIRNEADALDPAVIEAAAARVWSHLAAEVAAGPEAAGTHLRNCADFQALLPDYRAGRLPEARAALLQDHLHQCVACRKVYEGKVVAMPAARRPVRTSYTYRWAAAAVVVAAAGLSVWVAVDRFGGHTGRAVVQSVDGTLYVISAAGIQPLAAGQDLPDGVEIRTAKDSNAMLELRDGSTVELRERSALSTSQAARDITVRLNRGSVIVQAAHRSSGHLFVATTDCRVAVTGTIFSVSSGVKGSRVSVVQGEVHVSQDNRQKVLHPGEQTVTSDALEPVSVRDDISWSRNRERLVQQLDALRAQLEQIHLPALRYSSRLLNRVPSSTVLYASIPNLEAYLAEAQSVFHKQIAESPELNSLWASRGAGFDATIEKLRAASQYLGDEIVLVGIAGPNGGPVGPVFLAETRRPGFAGFLKKEVPPAVIVERSGMVVFGPDGRGVDAVAAALDAPDAGFQSTPFYARIAAEYQQGAGLLLCADLSRMALHASGAPRYLICEQKETGGQMQAAATLGFDGPRTGIASWLAPPAPMGSLDYVSPEATLVTAFVFKNPGAIVDEISGLGQNFSGNQKAFTSADAGFDARTELAAALGGEFSLSVDGPLIPVPSWKLVIEAYDPARLQATLQKVADSYNQYAVKSGSLPLRTSKETVDGRTYYMIAGADGSPLTEAHYTFADGYLIAGPSRALITKALQVKSAGTSITHSAQFVSMTPRDHFSNFSAVIFENLGTSLAPLVSLLGALAPQGQMPQGGLQGLSNIKPTMISAYGEPDRIIVASNGNVLTSGLTGLATGNLMGVFGSALPLGNFGGTRKPKATFQYK